MRFVPKEEKYFGMLNQLASQVRESAELFVKIFQEYDQPRAARCAHQVD